MVKGRVKKNVTTQLELLEMFGGPNIMTTDQDGTEVWMYDKTTSITSSTYSSSGTNTRNNQVALMARFFGLDVASWEGSGGVGSQQRDTSDNQGSNTITRTIKTITFIVKFNQDSTVKDYAVRQASY